MEPRYPLPPRIYARVEVNENGCWIVSGKPNDSGYYRVDFDGKSWYFHRLFCDAYNGELRPGNEVHHRCEVSACCNPEHLVQLTPAEHILADGKFPFIIGEPCPHCGVLLSGDNLGQVKNDGYFYCKKCRGNAYKSYRERIGEDEFKRRSRKNAAKARAKKKRLKQEMERSLA